MENGNEDCIKKHPVSCGSVIENTPCPDCLLVISVMSTYNYTMKNHPCDREIDYAMDTVLKSIRLTYESACENAKQMFADSRNTFTVTFLTCIQRFKFTECPPGEKKIIQNIEKCARCEMNLLFVSSINFTKNINVSTRLISYAPVTYSSICICLLYILILYINIKMIQEYLRM